MTAFSFDSNNLFLRYSNQRNNIQIYQLQNFDSFPLTTHDWKFVASIGPKEKCSSLKIFGTEIADGRLRNLQEDLCVSHLMINPEGFCYLDTTEITGPTFNVQYYRLNDLFSWSEYVDLPSEIKFNTSWNRYEIQTGETVVDYEHLNEELNKKNRLLETRLDEKDRKLKKLREKVSKLEQLNEELNKKGRLFKDLGDESESTREQLALTIIEMKSTEEELKQKQNELNDANNKISLCETRLDDKDKKLEKLREKVSKSEQHNTELNKKNRLLRDLEDELESIREQLAMARGEMKSTEEELKQKLNELNDANNKIFRYETRSDDKDKRIEKLHKKVLELEQLQYHSKELQENIEEVKSAATYEPEPSSTNDSPHQMRQEMRIEWQRLTNVWNQNKEKVGFFYINLTLTSTGTFVHPQFDVTLREFIPVDEFTYPHRSVEVRCKSGQFDEDNWWCIGSHEHNRRIDLAVYDGSFGTTEAYGTTVHIPYRQKYFFSNVQCFVGFLRGVGFRFMYVSAIHGVD